MSNHVETIIEVDIHNRNRATVFGRLILIVPIGVFLSSMTETSLWGAASGFLFLPALLALVFRGVYPSYVLNFNHALLELQTRISVYAFFLTDEYPSIERNPRVAVLLPDVEGGRRLNRWMPLVKWFLALPLYLVGFAYSLAAGVVTVIAWFVVLFTGRYPEWAVEIVLGTIKFWNRVYGYMLLLVTDEYPSFSFK